MALDTYNISMPVLVNIVTGKTTTKAPKRRRVCQELSSGESDTETSGNVDHLIHYDVI